MVQISDFVLSKSSTQKPTCRDIWILDLLVVLREVLTWRTSAPPSCCSIQCNCSLIASCGRGVVGKREGNRSLNLHTFVRSFVCQDLAN